MIILLGLVVVAGAAGLLGLSLLLAGARRASRRGRAARRGRKQSRRETAAASAARDDLTDQREITRARTASSPGNGTPRGSHQPATSGSRWNRLHLPGRRPAPRQAAAIHPQSRNGQPAPQTPAGASAPADDSLEEVSQP